MIGFETILPFVRPIEHLIRDDSISEIMVNGSTRVFIERACVLQKVPDLVLSEKSLMVAVKNIARRLGDDISEQKPILDSRLPDGSRVAAVIPPCSIHGVTLTIRKFNSRHFTLEDLVKCGSIDAILVERLKTYVEGRQNILISGGTGTGKTTLLNALGRLISDDDRILLIERYIGDSTRKAKPRPLGGSTGTGKPASRHDPRLAEGITPAPSRPDYSRGNSWWRGVRPSSTPQYRALRHALDCSRQFRSTSHLKIHELRSTERRGTPVSRHQEQHRRLA